MYDKGKDKGKGKENRIGKGNTLTIITPIHKIRTSLFLEWISRSSPLFAHVPSSRGKIQLYIAINSSSIAASRTFSHMKENKAVYVTPVQSFQADRKAPKKGSDENPSDRRMDRPTRWRSKRL